MLGRDGRRCGYRAPASRRSMKALLVAAPLVLLLLPWLLVMAASRSSTAAPASSGPPPAPTNRPVVTPTSSPQASTSVVPTAQPASASSVAPVVQPPSTTPAASPQARVAGATTANTTEGLSVSVSTSGNGVQAFFFLRGIYLGTDTLAPSGSIAVGPTTSDTITLLYGLYRPTDAGCCPSGGTAAVRYQWNGTRLLPLDPIPTNNPGAPLSRR